MVKEQLLRRHVNRFRGGFVFKTHRLVHQSTLGWGVIKKKKKKKDGEHFTGALAIGVEWQHLQQVWSVEWLR